MAASLKAYNLKELYPYMYSKIVKREVAKGMDSGMFSVKVSRVRKNDEEEGEAITLAIGVPDTQDDFEAALRSPEHNADCQKRESRL